MEDLKQEKCGCNQSIQSIFGDITSTMRSSPCTHQHISPDISPDKGSDQQNGTFGTRNLQAIYVQPPSFAAPRIETIPGIPIFQRIQEEKMELPETEGEDLRIQRFLCAKKVMESHDSHEAPNRNSWECDCEQCEPSASPGHTDTEVWEDIHEATVNMCRRWERVCGAVNMALSENGRYPQMTNN
jgi:hypothetical protein